MTLERGPRLLAPDNHRLVKHDFIKPRSVSMVRMLDASTGYVRLEGFEEKGGHEME